MPTTLNRFLRLSALLVWIGTLVGAVVLLQHLGTGTLAAPKLTGGGLNGWLQTVSASDMAMTVIRLLALVAAYYLLLTTVVSTVADFVGWKPLTKLADAISVPFVRSFVRNTVGLSVVASLAVPGVAMAAPASAPSTNDWPVLHHVAPATSTTVAPTTTTTTAPAPTTTTTVAPPTTTTTAAPAQTPPSATAPLMAEGNYTVRSGDTLWGISEQTLEGRLNRAPTDSEITNYLETVVDLNRAELADPAVPDLIFPGQHFRLP